MECIHDFQFVRRTNVDGNFQLRKQCVNCSKLLPQAYKHHRVEDILKIPAAVDDISWIAKREERQKQALIEKQKWDYEYNQYLKTDKWRLKRSLVLKRDNNICQACLSAIATEVHHEHYLNLFNEPLFDLVSVCRPCHTSIHKYKPDGFTLFNVPEIKHTTKYLTWKK